MRAVLHLTDTGSPPLRAERDRLVSTCDHRRYRPGLIDESIDLVVISVQDAATAIALLDRIREDGHRNPIQVVRGATGDWRPVGERHLVTLADPEAEPTDARGVAEGGTPAVVDLRHRVPRGGSRELLRERLGGESPALRASVDLHELYELPTRAVPGTPPSRPHDASGTGQATLPQPPAPLAPPARPRRHQRTSSPEELVAQLLPAVDRLYGVRETGTALASHLMEQVRVDAAVVMLPDDGVWRVAGATGHRHLEERLTLAAEHWLVKEVSTARHGVLVEDTDIARARLAGAPLAAWPHLLAAPLPPVDGIVLLARGGLGPAFTAHDLGLASSALSDTQPLLAGAVAVRTLARRLLTFAEVDDPSPP